MTPLSPAERDRLIASDQRLKRWNDAVAAKEAVLDEIAAYLKAARRTRTAKTRMYQYLGFRIEKLNQLVDRANALQVAENDALRAVQQNAR